jgi:hypothetical protein
VANRWEGRANPGEFYVSGSYLIASEPITHGTGNLRGGIAVDDPTTGIGFIMYSSEVVFDRFANHPPFFANSQFANSDHFIAVRYNQGSASWQYNDNFTWRNFMRTAGDRLLASVNFTTDTITSLQGTNSLFQGMTMGYIDGDLTFAANQFDGVANTGEFEVGGTYFTA